VLSDDPFPIIDVTGWVIVEEETSGATPKLWLAEPGTDPEVHWLFKAVTVKYDHVHGEDWAEKAASHLGAFLAIPRATVELARWNAFDGCISRNLRPTSCQMQPGRAQLEMHSASGYTHRSKGKDHPGHTLDNIRAVLSGASPPPDCALPFDGSAFDVFAGYVLFDAWIANQDRHDHNWSVLIPGTATPGPTRLSGSYDHGSSLGFGMQDAKCEEMLATQGSIERWCARGQAMRLEGRPSLVDAAREALELASSEARAHWLEQLQRVRDSDVRRVIDRITRMSEAQRSFAVKLLEVNRRRLLDVCA
jgi:HipA-like C-terminal domain